MLDETFARASRERCLPSECDSRTGCWVTEGPHSADRGKAARCITCNGVILHRNWRPPQPSMREVLQR